MTAKKIVLYVTGGIAAYKVPLLARDLIKKGYQVRVAMTQEAQQYVTPTTLQVLTKQPVYTDFTPQDAQYVPHIHLAQWANLAVVVPATANIIAKMAQGLADDFVSTTLLATPGPILVVPAMNDHMWENPATQRNIAQLKADGKRVLEPAHGFLAEGYVAKGRMPEPAEISQAIDESFQPQDLQEKRIVITAGGTQEDLDPVRYLTNKSSGKMGYALARVAQVRGAQVTLISGPTNLTPPTGVDFQSVRTAQEMQAKVNQVYAQADVVIMAAAVADYLPAQTSSQKIKKNQDVWHLELKKNVDILQGLGQAKSHQFLVGFAAETQDLIANGQKKLAKKNLDLLVANDVSRSDIGFNSDQNEVTFLAPHQAPRKINKAQKYQIAQAILDEIKTRQGW